MEFTRMSIKMENVDELQYPQLEIKEYLIGLIIWIGLFLVFLLVIVRN